MGGMDPQWWAEVGQYEQERQERELKEHDMSNIVPYADMKAMAKDIAASGLFGMKNETQVLALMAVAQAENKHPAIVARDYDIVQGRPAKKAEAMLRDFIASGGKVEWHQLDDTCADATFSHPQGGTVRISWDKARAVAAGLAGKDMYKKFPRQMLRSRVVSEGVRTVAPLATSGFYVPEEVAAFDDKPRAIDMGEVVEAKVEVVDAEADDGANDVIALREAAAIGDEALVEVWDGMERDDKARAWKSLPPDIKAVLTAARAKQAA